LVKQRMQIKLPLFLLIAISSTLSLPWQSAGNDHFTKPGIAFDYPADWKVTDQSADRGNTILLASSGKTQSITVLTDDIPLKGSCDFDQGSAQVRSSWLETTKATIQAAKEMPGKPITTHLSDGEIEGTQISGRINGHAVTAEIYSVRRSLIVVGLIYVHFENDHSSEPAWDLLRRTLVISPGSIMVVGVATKPQSSAPEASGNSESRDGERTAGSVVNGRAVHLVQPQYPTVARRAHASGTVEVQVIIDEAGDVIAAHAISGHPLLQAAGVAAARASKFSATKLCGEAVRVTGVIQYNFVAQ
jgi:TonB family protein